MECVRVGCEDGMCDGGVWVCEGGCVKVECVKVGCVKVECVRVGCVKVECEGGMCEGGVCEGGTCESGCEYKVYEDVIGEV